MTKFEEGQNGTFTIRGTITEVTPSHINDEQFVTVQFEGSLLKTSFFEGFLEDKFEADEPEYLDGVVYIDDDDKFWEYVSVPGFAPGWFRFGDEREHPFDKPKRPLRRVTQSDL